MSNTTKMIKALIQVKSLTKFHGFISIVQSDGILNISGFDTDIDITISISNPNVPDYFVIMPADTAIKFLKSIESNRFITGSNMQATDPSKSTLLSDCGKGVMWQIPKGARGERVLGFLKIKSEWESRSAAMNVTGVSTSGSSDLLLAALVRVAPHVSTDLTRYYINGVYFEKNKIIATDGHRAGIHDLDSNLDFQNFILPVKATKLLIQILKSESGEFTATSEGKFVKFNIGNTVITSKVIDGNFPDYRKAFYGAIEGEKKIGATIDSADLIKIASPSTGSTTFRHSTSTVDILDVESIFTINSTDVFGDKDFGLDSKYLKSFAQHSVNGKIAVSSASPADQFLVDIGVDDFKGIVMPIWFKK